MKSKNLWESARLISYITAQTQSTRTLSPTDIIKFHWEEDGKEQEKEEIDWDEIEQIKREMKEMENQQ